MSLERAKTKRPPNGNLTAIKMPLKLLLTPGWVQEDHGAGILSPYMSPFLYRAGCMAFCNPKRAGVRPLHHPMVHRIWERSINGGGKIVKRESHINHKMFGE
jgi:hypothetical protein